MEDDVADLLNDILAEARSIKEFVDGHTLESYATDKKTRFAVERCFEIIGEALNRLNRIAPEILDLIENQRSIRSFRNILAHAYDHVEDKIVWGIIERDLDSLIRDIQRLKQ